MLALQKSLDLLLKQNRDGLLKSSSSSKGGFEDHITGRTRMCGVMRFITEKTKAFPSLSRYEYRLKSSKQKAKTKEAKRLKKEKSSSKANGEKFHRLIYHFMFCTTKKCNCLFFFNKKTEKIPKSGKIFNLLNAASKFLKDNNLIPIAAEQVIVATEVPVATRFDCLCYQQNTGKVTLVSWKTGYKTLVPPEVADGSSMMRTASTSEQISFRKHIAQVTCEINMLVHSHKINVKQAYIVYLGTSGDYRCSKLNNEWTGSAKGYRIGWDWLVKKYQLLNKKLPRIKKTTTIQPKSNKRKTQPPKKHSKKPVTSKTLIVINNKRRKIC